MLIGFGYDSDFNANNQLFEIDIEPYGPNKGQPVVGVAATIDLGLLPNNGLQRIPMEWIGIEVSTFEILILDGSGSMGLTPLDPILCNMNTKLCDYATGDRFTEVKQLNTMGEFDSFTKSLAIKNMKGQVDHVLIWGSGNNYLYDWNMLHQNISRIERYPESMNLDNLEAIQVESIDWLLNGKFLEF